MTANNDKGPGSWLPVEQPSLKKRPLFLLIVLAIPLAMVSFLTYRSVRMEQVLVEENLFRHADALARSLEASSRAGMMHAFLEEGALDSLLLETAQEAGALLLMIAAPDGSIVAAGGTLDPGELDRELIKAPPKPGSPPYGYFLIDDQVYVYRKALRGIGDRPRGRRMGGMMGRRPLDRPIPKDSWLLVMLDASGPLSLGSQHKRVTILLAILLAAAASGILGWIFWSQRAKETMAALMRTESYAQQLVLRMPAGLILADTTGRIQMVNPAAESLLEKTGSELLRQNVQSLLSPDLLPFQSIIAGGSLPILEGRLSKEEDNGTTISLAATPLADKSGTITNVLILFQDVSEFHSLRKRLVHAERLAEIGQIASTVAHEIRNPLSSIRGFAQLLAGKVPEDHRNYTQVMVEEVDRLNRVVTGLLSYTKVESPEPGVWPVQEILEHVRTLAQSDGGIKGVTIELEPAREDLVWMFDRDMIIQALLNLVMNALEASEYGQTVLLGARVKGNSLQFTVTDQGPGINEEEADRLFTLFYTTRDRGTGLGLSLVRKTADLHGGSARISRAGPDGGTMAVLELPRDSKG
jgi:two-component system sensor histidine kinase HydH